MRQYQHQQQEGTVIFFDFHDVNNIEKYNLQIDIDN